MVIGDAMFDVEMGMNGIDITVQDLLSLRKRFIEVGDEGVAGALTADELIFLVNQGLLEAGEKLTILSVDWYKAHDQGIHLLLRAA